MRNFIHLGNVDILPSLLQLERNVDLWNQNRDRKDRKNTSHSEMDDIWLRYRAREELTSDQTFQELHYPVWYPAMDRLYELRPILSSVMHRILPLHVGGILITKIPPGGKILPHSDKGSWHAEFFNTKVYVPLKSNLQCVNHTEDESLNMKPGEVWTFDNLKMHSVENNGTDDRITLIMCFRCE